MPPESDENPRRAAPRRWPLVGLGLIAGLLLIAFLATQTGDEGPAPPRQAPAPPRQAPTPRTPPGPPGRVLWGSGFEDGDLSVYDRILREGSGEDGEVSITTERSRTGRRSVRLVLPPSTSGGTVGRLQLVAGLPDGHAGQERWYGVSMYLGDDWLLEQLEKNRPLFLGTLGFRYTETDDNGPGSNIGVRREGPTPIFSTSLIPEGEGDDVGDQLLGPVAKNRWIDFVLHIRWSLGADGLREVWRDGVNMGRYEGPTLALSSAFEHRMGVYQGTAVDHTRTLYWDNHRVGTSYAAVDPAR